MMRGLTAPLLLLAWEAAREEEPVARALALLGAALPGQSRAELAALPIPERDRLLLELRARTFGGQLHGAGACPACECRVEFEFATDELLGAPRAAGGPIEIAAEGI